MAKAPSPDSSPPPGDFNEVTDAAVLAASGVAPGTRLGRYEILMPVASGGMARVWAARLEGQRGFSKLVAIKTILPHLAEDPEFERMFLDEARIASGIQHPNVCQILELGEEGQVLYLAMEWINGDSLHHVLRGSGSIPVALDPHIGARVVADACAGLHAAHELEGEDGRPLGVVHRDVSPQNVLVSVDGHAKMADFGVAKALGQLHGASIAGELRGKLHYMSPEQMSGGDVDRRSDVFALGCVLYEATTGIKAFDGELEHLAMQAVLAGRYPRPSQLVPGYPAALEQIIARALARAPADRYPSADRLRTALEQWLAKSASLLVTHSDVARVVRSRVGARVDRRKDQWKQALAARGERPPMPSTSPEAAPGRRLPEPTRPRRPSAPSFHNFGRDPDRPPSSSRTLVSQPPSGATLVDRTAPPGYATPPAPALAAERAGFDLMDPPIPSVAPPPGDVAELAARVEAPEPVRGARGLRILPIALASIAALLAGLAGGLAWRVLREGGHIEAVAAPLPRGQGEIRDAAVPLAK